MTHQVQLYGRDLVHKYDLDTKQRLEPETRSYPTEVAFGSDGICYVTIKTQCVLMYSEGCMYKDKWPAVSPQHKLSDTEDTELNGLTIDSMGQVLVGEVKQKYISTHKPDGRHVATIKVDIAPASLAVTSLDSIIVSDWNESVHIVDNGGQLLHAVKPPSHVQKLDPAGIACYEDIICISNGHAKRIHCFSVSGDYLGDIPIIIPGNPTNLAFTADGKQLLVSSCRDYVHGVVAVYKYKE